MGNFKFDFKIELNPNLEKDLAGHSHDMIKEEFVDKVLYIAKDKSPYLTGHNRDSILAKKSGNRTGGFGWKMGTTSRYGGYLELGTARMPARPYFAPAIKEAFEAMKRKYG